jgi:hypothetical protein
VGADLFGLGAREAVLTALRGVEGVRPVFGAPVDVDELLGVLASVAAPTPPTMSADAGSVVVTTDDARVRWTCQVAAYAHGWRVSDTDASRIRLVPAAP